MPSNQSRALPPAAPASRRPSLPCSILGSVLLLGSLVSLLLVLGVLYFLLHG